MIRRLQLCGLCVFCAAWSAALRARILCRTCLCWSGVRTLKIEPYPKWVYPTSMASFWSCVNSSSFATIALCHNRPFHLHVLMNLVDLCFLFGGILQPFKIVRGGSRTIRLRPGQRRCRSRVLPLTGRNAKGARHALRRKHQHDSGQNGQRFRKSYRPHEQFLLVSRIFCVAEPTFQNLDQGRQREPASRFPVQRSAACAGPWRPRDP
jgi:hypothetical protein